MIEAIEPLIAALRDELQQYGELLALLDQQQDRVLARAADDLHQIVADIHAQGCVIQAARVKRESARRALARRLALPESAPVAQVLPLLPEEYRPLVQALVEENNQLLFRVQQRTRQNHLLLARSVELLQRFMGTLFPANHGPTYDGRGTMFPTATPAHSVYEAVG